MKSKGERRLVPFSSERFNRTEKRATLSPSELKNSLTVPKIELIP